MRYSANAPQVKKQLWGGEFWTDGYFASTAGKHGSENTIANYVKAQGANYAKVMLLANLKLSRQPRKMRLRRGRTWHLIEPGNNPHEVHSGGSGGLTMAGGLLRFKMSLRRKDRQSPSLRCSGAGAARTDRAVYTISLPELNFDYRTMTLSQSKRSTATLFTLRAGCALLVPIDRKVAAVVTSLA